MSNVPARRGRRQPLNKIKVLYYLRLESRDMEGYVTLRGVARFHGVRFNFSPAERVLPTQLVGSGRGLREVALWEPKSCRVLPDHPRAREINKELQRWEDNIVAAFEQLSAPSGHTLVTREMMEAAIFPGATPAAATAPERLTFAEHNQAWQQENAGVLAANTLRKYNQVIVKLEEFRPGMPAGDLSEKMAQEYLQFLLRLGLMDTSIELHYRFFRLVQKRMERNDSVAWLKYKGESGTKLGLEPEELAALIRVRIPANHPKLQQERDQWLLECFSGRRYEDMAKLGPEQLTSVKLKDGQRIPALLHTQTKTTKEALSPLPPIAVAIGERWGWQFPPVQNGDRNRTIKQVAKLAGLTRLFNDVHIAGGRATDDYRPVHELISTHTARHTCAELLTEGGDDNKDLARFVLGHTEPGVTEVYAKTKARRLAPKVLAAWAEILGELYEGTPAW